jgi:hypothetical protein
VQYFLLVAISDSSQELIGEAFDYEGIHSLFLAEVIHVFLEVEIEIFEDEYEFAVGVDDFSQIDDVDVVEFFEDGDFADGGGRDAFFFAFESDLFECEDFSGLFV